MENMTDGRTPVEVVTAIVEARRERVNEHEAVNEVVSRVLMGLMAFCLGGMVAAFLVMVLP